MGLARSPSSRAGALLALAIVAGFVLRGVEAHVKSLWLDELHSVWASRGESFAEVIERVRVDFHPPLYFLLLHWLEELGGLRPHGQRWLSILLSMATVLPLLGILRAANLSRLAQAVGCGIFAASSYQILYGAELRAYSALQLAAVTMVWAAFTDRASAKARFWAFAAALGIGLNMHYFAGLAAIATLVARALFRAKDAPPERRVLPWTRLVLAAAIGGLCFLPWIVTKEKWLLTNPSKLWRWDPPKAQLADMTPTTAEGSDGTAQRPEPPRKELTGPDAGDYANAARIPLRSLALRVAPNLRRAFVAPTQSVISIFFALCLAGGVVFLVRLARGDSVPGGARLWGPIAAAGVAYALVAAGCLWIWRDVPNRYFAIFAWVWPVVCATLVDALPRARLRAVYAGLLLAAGLVIGVHHVTGGPREDFREAVQTARWLGRDKDPIYTAILWQPRWYPHVIPYMAYAPDVDALEPRLVPPADGEDARPVVVITRNVVVDKDKSTSEEWARIRKGRRLVRNVSISVNIKVLLLEPE